MVGALTPGQWLLGAWMTGAVLTLVLAVVDLTRAVRNGELEGRYVVHWTVGATLLAGAALWPLTWSWVLLVQARHRRARGR